MATIKTKGIIIKRNNFGEADRIITIITSDRGKLRVVAKGVRKPQAKLAGHLELFHYNEFLLAEGKNLDIVTGASTIDTLSGIGKDLKSVAMACYIAETVDKLVEETQDAHGIMKLMYEALQALNGDSANLDYIKSWFELNLLAHLGFKPELNCCTECGKEIEKERAWFSLVSGGLLDQMHHAVDISAQELSGEELKMLRHLMNSELKLRQPITSVISKLTESCMDYTVDRNLKTKKFLAETSFF